MSNKYAEENIGWGTNRSIPYYLRGERSISDKLFNSVGLYSKKDIEYARFHNFSRFGRILDPYGKVNAGREYLFFVKPDLHICIPFNGQQDGQLYTMSGLTGDTVSANGLTLNPQLCNHPYFVDLIKYYPDVIRELQYGVSENNSPFSNLLSFSVNGGLNLDSQSAQTLENPATIYGTTYKYLQDSEASDEAYNFSLEFVDNKYLDTYHFFKAYAEYHNIRKSGLVTPPDFSYYKYKRLHNTMGIYKFIVAEDMETLLYWAYICGAYPTTCPREAFQDASFSDGLTFSVSFESAFIEDMNPMILNQFNELMIPMVSRRGHTIDDWMPIVDQDRYPDWIDGSLHSYDTKTNTGNRITINGIESHIGPTSNINGDLPSAALVDGRYVNNEKHHKYRLRWYS